MATGTGDIPSAVTRAAARRGVALKAVGLDLSPEILSEAARVSNGPLEFVRGDARSLPFGDSTFDVVSLCLALHHFDPPDAVRVLKEMWRVARAGIVVIDLRRSSLAFAAVWVLANTIARNRVTRHDGPLSVLRAYTPGEVLDLAMRAGITSPRVSGHGPARLILTADKPGHGR